MTNDEEPKKAPENHFDITKMAKRILSKFQTSQDIDDLFSAVLATSHIADWYHPGKKPGDFRKEFAKKFPEWDHIRDLGNGLKHVEKSKIKTRHLDFDDPGFWKAFEDEETLVWSTDFKGKSIMISDLCYKFIESFEIHLSQPPLE